MSLRSTIALVAVLASGLAATPAAAHVIVQSDFRNPVPLGAMDRFATVTVVNEDPIPIDPEEPEPTPFTVCNVGECGSSQGVTLVPSCASQGAAEECTAIDPGVFAIGSAATGAQSGCAGMQFTVTEIGPEKLSFNPATPGQHIVLPPQYRCRIEFTLDVLKAPAVDARPTLDGLQTAQVTEVRSTTDLQTGTGVPDIGSDHVSFFDPRPPASPRVPAKPGVDAIDPLLTALTLSRARFRSAASGRAIVAAAPVGTRVGYRLSEAARVTFRVERARRGRRVRGRCVTRAVAHPRTGRCSRYVELRGSFTHDGHAGANGFRFRGRLQGRRLAPGSYRLRAIAMDAAGNSSVVMRRSFRIVRR